MEKIKYVPKSNCEDTLIFRHYNNSEILLGKRMDEWLSFSANLSLLKWQMGNKIDFSRSKEFFENVKSSIKNEFKIFQSLGIKHYNISSNELCFNKENREKGFDFLSLLKDNQSDFKLTLQYFIFSNDSIGSMQLNHNSHYFAYKCYQLKVALDSAKHLDAKNFLFKNILNHQLNLNTTSLKDDLKHLLTFYKMAVKYKEAIKYKGQFVILSSPSYNLQIESDVNSILAFLKNNDLEHHFKLVVVPGNGYRPYESDAYMASCFKMLNGFACSEFQEEKNKKQLANEIRNTTTTLKCVLDQNGFDTGGIILDIGGNEQRTGLINDNKMERFVLVMDIFAKSLRNTVKLINDGVLRRNLHQRYLTYKNGFGEDLGKGTATFEECEKFIIKAPKCRPISSRYEHFENILNYYTK